MTKCSFCSMNKEKIENTILEETKHFYITPSLGAIVEGYVLIISKRHINSMSELNNEEMEEYENLIKKYIEIFKSIYKKSPIVFEHGTPNIKEKNIANSVIHAHTHIVNHNYRNENALIENLNFKKISKIRNFNNGQNYIFYISPNNNIYITYDFKPISQIMRIEIAKDFNIYDKYDWRKNKFEDNIILTIKKINGYLSKK